MAWTNRYQDKWPRLTALYNLEQQDHDDSGENPIQGFGPTVLPPGVGGYYRYYAHPDDIRSSGSMSAYSMSQRSNESPKPRKTQYCGICLGTMLAFSLAAVISVSVVLSILWTEPQGFASLSSNGSATTLETHWRVSVEKCQKQNTLVRIDSPK